MNHISAQHRGVTTRVTRVLVVAFFACALSAIPQIGNAQWVQPSCNPDGPGGPTDPSCNVSAPVNVSPADQVKQGGFTVQNLLQAGDLRVMDTLGGNGSIFVETGSAQGISVVQNNPTFEAIKVKTNTAVPGVNIDQSGKAPALRLRQSATTGRALQIDLDATQSEGIVIDANTETVGLLIDNLGTDSTGIIVNSTSGTATGVSISTADTALKVKSGANLPDPVAEITGTSTGTALKLDSSGGYALQASTGTSAPYAAEFCRSGSGCAYLGGFPYNAFIPGDVYIQSALEPFNPLLRVNHGNTSATPGFAAQLYQSGTGQPLVPQLAPQGTAIDAQAVDGNALYAYSMKGDGIGVQVEAPNTAGIRVDHAGNAFSLTTVNTGVEVNVQGQQAVGVASTTPEGTAGRFTSGEARTALSVVSAPNTAGTAGGTGVLVNPGAGGTGIRVESSFHGNLGGGTGVRITARDGANGIVVKGENNAASNVGLSLQLSKTDIGVQAVSQTPFDLGIDANGQIVTEGSSTAGVFYTSGRPSTAVQNSHTPQVMRDIQLGSSDLVDLVYDGTDLWVSAENATVYRVNATTGRIIAELDLSHVNNQLAVGGRYIYAVGTDIAPTPGQGFEVRYSRIDPLSDVVNDGGTGEFYTPSALAHDGERLWIGATQDTGIYTYDVDNGSGGIIGGLPGGSGPIYDLLFAEGLVYASASGLDVVLEIDPAGPGVQQQIPVGGGPRELLYDGRFMWVGNYTGNTISRVDLDSNERQDVTSTLQPYGLAFDGGRLWYSSHTAASDQLRAHDIAHGSDDISSRVETGRRPTKLVFDGTSLWVLRSYNGSGGDFSLQQVAIDEGHGLGGETVHNGVLMYGLDEDLYCVYIDGSGNLQTDTSLVNCEN